MNAECRRAFGAEKEPHSSPSYSPIRIGSPFYLQTEVSVAVGGVLSQLDGNQKLCPLLYQPESETDKKAAGEIECWILIASSRKSETT